MRSRTLHEYVSGDIFGLNAWVESDVEAAASEEALGRAPRAGFTDKSSMPILWQWFSSYLWPREEKAGVSMEGVVQLLNAMCCWGRGRAYLTLLPQVKSGLI